MPLERVLQLVKQIVLKQSHSIWAENTTYMLIFWQIKLTRFHQKVKTLQGN